MSHLTQKQTDFTRCLTGLQGIHVMNRRPLNTTSEIFSMNSTDIITIYKNTRNAHTTGRQTTATMMTFDLLQLHSTTHAHDRETEISYHNNDTRTNSAATMKPKYTYSLSNAKFDKSAISADNSPDQRMSILYTINQSVG